MARKPAARGGEPRALCALGTWANHGIAGKKSSSRAADYFTQAAKLGHAEAAYDLGVCYATGRAKPRNLRLAFRWYLKAAQRGDLDADAVAARLFHQRNQGAFRRGIGRVGRQEAVHFVEDDEGAEAFAAGEAADPGEDFFEHDAEDERAFFVVQVGDAQDDAGGFAGARGEPAFDVERRTLAQDGDAASSGAQRHARAALRIASAFP